MDWCLSHLPHQYSGKFVARILPTGHWSQISAPPTPAQHRHARREQRATHTHEYWSPKALINNQSQTYLHKVCLRWNGPQMKLSDRYLHLKIHWNLLDYDGSPSSMAQQPKVTVLACSLTYSICRLWIYFLSLAHINYLAYIVTSVCRSICIYFWVCLCRRRCGLNSPWLEILRSRDPDWPPPNWSGSGSSEKDLPKHSRVPNVCHLFCFDLSSSVIACVHFEKFAFVLVNF